MSNYNRNQKTYYVTDENRYIYDALIEESERTKKGTGFLLFEAYAIKNKLKAPVYTSKGDKSKKRRYENERV